jgi:hypothetical protein
MQKKNNANKKLKTSLIRTLVILVFFVLVVSMIISIKKSQENLSQSKDQQITPNQSLDNTINFEPSAPSENDIINEQKKNADKPADNSEQLIATITNASFYQGIARIRILVTGGATSGSCKMTLSSPDKKETIVNQATITLKGNQYSCDGFDVEKSEFKTSGEWVVEVVVSTESGNTSTAVSTLNVGI